MRHDAKNGQHGTKNVQHAAKNVRHGAKNVRHGGENVRHVAQNPPIPQSPNPQSPNPLINGAGQDRKQTDTQTDRQTYQYYESARPKVSYDLLVDLKVCCWLR